MSIIQQLERVPPQNLEAEQGVLGSMLLDRDAIARVLEALRPEDFYRDAHRVIFAAMIDLFERGEPVDLITVTNRLGGMGKIEDIGGATYLASLPNVVPTAANVDYYAGIVLEKSMLRSLINAGTHIAALGYEGDEDIAALIDHAERLVFGIAARRNVQDFQAIKEILKESFEKIDKRYQEKGTVTGIPTSFTDLDMVTSGLQPSDMIVVAARPSVGKCLSHDAEIVLADGTVTTIEDVYRRKHARLLTLGANWKLGITEPSAFVDDGIKPVFRVTTRLGRTVECTASHPFLTIEGWLPLAALRAGERIAVPRRVGVFGNKPMRECDVALLAYVVGGASPTTLTTAFARAHPVAADDFSRAARAIGARGRSHRTRLTSWLERWGLRGAGPTTRCIPAGVFTLPRRQLARFLSRLFAIGGRPAARHADPSKVTFTAGSERLARQVQHLLLRFGILAAIRPLTVVTRDVQRSTWQVEISDPASLWLFAGEIGIFGRQPQIERVVAALTDRARRPNMDILSSGVCQVLASARTASASWTAARTGGFVPRSNVSAEPPALSRDRLLAIVQTLDPAALAQFAESDVYWDEIVSIEPGGSKQVYDLTIPATHNFVANDVCVHNTTFCLNIAQHAALTQKIPVAIFSLETSKEQLVQRILCSEAQVDNTKLRTGFLADEDWRKLARAMGGLSEAPIFIDDSATLSVVEMRAKARKLKAEYGLGLIVIDYIQLIQSFRRTENRTQELSEIARNIKSLAKELDVPIIAISQLSRAVEALGQKRPMLSHLRECVTGDTLVFLADGQRAPICKLAGTAPSVLSMAPDGRIVRAAAQAVWPVGRREVVEATLASGRTIRMTRKHRLYGSRGWVHAGELSIGDVLRVESGNDLLWDRVISVEPAGEEEVFDLTVPGPASWLADGIVSHNSGEIEQVSDLVLFLYREDYYDQEKAQKENKENICEVIIAKHRNGPIGTVELYFHKEHSRFDNLAKQR